MSISPQRPIGDSGLYTRNPAWVRGEADRTRHGDRRSRWLYRRERIPIPACTRLIEDPPRNGRVKTGICCSGGGIRSAAFNLGALQQLQVARRLHSAAYLAAVSGGAYIAAAFTMVAKTHPPDEPAGDDSDPQLVNDASPPFHHGSPEEQYLRNRSTYMAPRGLGKVRFVVRVGLGLLVNLAFLTSALVLVAWALALYYRWVHDPLQAPAGAAAGTQEWEWVVVVGATLLAVGCGILSLFQRSSADRTRAALESLTIKGLGLAALLAVVMIALPEAVAALRRDDTVPDLDVASPAAGGSIAMLLATVVLELRSRVSIGRAGQALGRYRKLAEPLRRAVAHVAAWIVGPLLLGAILLYALLGMVGAQHISALAIGAVAAVFLLFCVASDVTTWSLHPFYRRRLCTAFALKRVRRPDVRGDPVGMAVEREYDVLALSESAVRPGPVADGTWPTLVVCAAANVSDHGATPAGRSVTSFTFSPVAVGGPLIGGVPTAAFEDHMPSRRRCDMTLAAAVAMSGAAVSPSMGKATRPSIRLLLALANVRLGVWMPNPRRVRRWLETDRGVRTRLARHHVCDGARVTRSLAGADTSSAVTRGFRRRFTAPRPGPRYLVKEMLGRNSIDDAFLYVTDGGHYENLGLVELLRRGCTEVFCFDASGGDRFDALGDAISLARSELGIEIDDMDLSPLVANEDRVAASCCTTGRITYPSGATGVLIYARPVVTPAAPLDVQAFRIRDPAFPRHSTFDQLYTDAKFEAYRMLGVQAGLAAVSAAPDARGGAAAYAGAA